MNSLFLFFLFLMKKIICQQEGCSQFNEEYGESFCPYIELLDETKHCIL